MSELINEFKKLKAEQQDDSCSKKEPFIKLGKGVAPLLNYNIPQSACFSTYGHHFVKGISQDMFLPATKKKPAGNYFEITAKLTETDLRNRFAEAVQLQNNDGLIPNIVRYEGQSNDYQEYLWIAHTINNEVLRRGKTTVYDLLMTGYSRSSEKYPMRFFDDRSKYAVAAVIDVYNGGTDPTNGATLWDGTDFLAWGLKSTNGTPHNKFEEYKSIFIKKDVYDKYLENTLKKYSNGKARYKVKGNNVYYDIPADVFKNQENWSSGDFLYNTGVNKPYDIESIDTKGYTIFWKKVK